MKILITGRSGMLGRQVASCFPADTVKSLGRDRSNDFVVDLTDGTLPPLKGEKFDLVVHCAGTCEEADAMSLNLGGTKRLLQAMSDNPPKTFVFVSGFQVYSQESGAQVGETPVRWASDAVGQSKALAEAYATEWCRRHGVTLTVVRPARMFGPGVHGETERMFRDVVRGNYIHVRGCEGKTSIVTALDVARVIVRIHPLGGIYNVADGRDASWRELAEAMSANAGQHKRMTTLPAPWAKWIYRLGGFLPAVAQNLNPAILAHRSRTFTLDISRLRETLEAEGASPLFHDTLAVIARDDPEYPYEED